MFVFLFPIWSARGPVLSELPFTEPAARMPDYAVHNRLRSLDVYCGLCVAFITAMLFEFIQSCCSRFARHVVILTVGHADFFFFFFSVVV